MFPQARKLESELDMKIAAYGKLCSGYEYGHSTGESGLAADQQLQSKAGEIQRLLARLGDANDAMRSTLSGGADARSHTLARHRDILHDFQQVGAACFLEFGVLLIFVSLHAAAAPVVWLMATFHLALWLAGQPT